MKSVTLIFSLLLMSFSNWSTDFESAKITAKQENKLILLNFSGSDWCGNCILLKREIFEDTIFKQFSNNNLILVNADFPRQKKNQLTPNQQKQNGQLAELYNKKGIFPLTILLTSDGSILKIWEGKPKENTKEFISTLNSFISKN